MICKLAHRIPCIHLKDGEMIIRKDAWAPELKITEMKSAMKISTGLPFLTLANTPASSGISWNAPMATMDFFAILERSCQNLRNRMGL